VKESQESRLGDGKAGKNGCSVRETRNHSFPPPFPHPLVIFLSTYKLFSLLERIVCKKGNQTEVRTEHSVDPLVKRYNNNMGLQYGKVCSRQILLSLNAAP
jgi:hypothetical protein